MMSLRPKPSPAASEPVAPRFHALDADAVARLLATDPGAGLVAAEAARRLLVHGPNTIVEKPRRSPLRMLFAQFGDFLIVILMVAAVISGIIGDLKDAIFIALIVVINAAIGFAQEYRVERALAALKRLVPAQTVVIRDGRHLNVDSDDLVPGDLVVLDAGAQIPADLRLVDAGGIRTGEATLTGESAPVEKQAAALADADLPLGDRSNMAFKGTTVTYGHGRGIAVATGMATELGKVAGLLGEGEEPRTPLQERLGEFGKRLAVVVFAICAIIFVAGLVRGEDTALMFLTAVSLAVAAIPEALPATVTISLAIGARKMVERNALVRRLAAVETLGSVTFICSDKTGTLTRNQMQVDAVVIADAGGRPIPRQNEPADALFAAIALNNHAHRAEDGNGSAIRPRSP